MENFKIFGNYATDSPTTHKSMKSQVKLKTIPNQMKIELKISGMQPTNKTILT